MSSLEDELDRLYQLPLGEFVKARNDLASRLKKSGDAEGSKRVKELSKPSVSAWAVNQLYWKDRETFRRLIEAGDRYRKAHRAAVSGAGPEALAGAEEERRKAIAAAERRAREILKENGQSPGASVGDRIATTLEAIAAYGSDNPNPMKGRMTEDATSPGFGALSFLGEVIPFPSPAARAAEKEPADERARLEQQRAQQRKALEAAVERERRAEAELEAARSRLARAKDQLARAESEVAAAEAERDARRASVAEAQRMLEELGESSGD